MIELKAKLKLDDIISDPNIAKRLSKEDLNTIAEDVIVMHDLDRNSRSIWEDMAKKAIDLAKLIHTPKDTPWPGASNVHYPTIATAVMQFVARIGPELVKNSRVVKGAIKGSDEQGTKEIIAEKIGQHMSYQLLYQMDGWEEDFDRRLNMLATIGTVFVKTYYDPIKKHPVSITCDPFDIYIHNDAINLEHARRVTHKYTMHKNELIAYQRKGLYLELDSAELDRETITSQQHDYIHEVLEQHRYLDLDNDGYEEPYVVTVDKDLRKVLRIVARWDEDGVQRDDRDKLIDIKPVQYFTDYHFLRAPDGSFYSLGFGQLMFSVSHSIDTLTNQLIDSGTLANTQCGFMSKTLRLKPGQNSFQQGQFITVGTSGIDNLNNHIYQMQFKEPSMVLYQLLGLLINASKELSSITDALMGKEQVQNVPATSMLAQIEQGTKILSAIQRRLYRAMKREFEKLFRLNKIFLDREVTYLSNSQNGTIRQADYENADIDVCPVADPNFSSEEHRMATIRATLEPMQQIPNSGINTYEVLHRYFEALETPNIDKILPPPDPNAPPPVDVIKTQAEIQAMGAELDIKKQANEKNEKDMLIRAHLAEADYANKMADAELKLAQAAQAGAQAQAMAQQPVLDYYKAQIEQLRVEASIQQDIGNPETRTNEAARESMGEPQPVPPGQEPLPIDQQQPPMPGM